MQYTAGAAGKVIALILGLGLVFAALAWMVMDMVGTSHCYICGEWIIGKPAEVVNDVSPVCERCYSMREMYATKCKGPKD